MVFRKAPHVTKVAGTHIPPKPSEDPRRFGKHVNLTLDQVERRANALNAVEAIGEFPGEPSDKPDVFANHASLSEMPVYERQRIIHDQGGYVDKWLGQMAVIAEERSWLDQQLVDPRWADHPSRPDAIKQRAEFDEQLRDIADSIAWAEAWADRCWQTLKQEQREPIAHMWLTDPADERLLCRSWADQAQYGWKWPKGCRVEARWFTGLPEPIYTPLTVMWMHTTTWLGEPVEIDESAEEARMEDFARHVKSMMN